VDGVAIYPGARVVMDKDSKGDNLTLDWGQDSTHPYVQKYVTADSPEKVLSFYRNQLAKYGKVLGGAGVGGFRTEVRRFQVPERR